MYEIVDSMLHLDDSMHEIDDLMYQIEEILGCSGSNGVGAPHRLKVGRPAAG